jgi:Flp pilus assembly protein TadD
MRFLKSAVLVAACAVLLSVSMSAAAGAGQSLSGRVIFENLEFACDPQCVITLLASGVRPVQTVYADLAGNFTFTNVGQGPFSIRVEINGVEAANQPIDAFGGGRVTIMVPLARKPEARDGNAPIVDVSEFLNQYPKKAVSHFEKGNDFLKKKKPEEAIKYLRSAVELAPTFYQAHQQLGIAYRDAGRRADAEREFVTAHELNARGIDPLLNLTALYLEDNDTVRAIEVSEQAVKINSQSAHAHFNLGVVLYKAGQFERAETSLKRALDLAPKRGDFRLALANVYLKLQRYDSTLEQLDSYISENPKGEQLPAAVAMRDQLLQAKFEAGRP